MKNLIVLLIVGLTGVSCFGVVAAQELLIAPPGSDVGGMIPELALPPMPESVLEGDEQIDGDYTDEGSSSEHYVTTPYVDSWESGEYSEQFEPYVTDDYQMFQCNDPVLESTGTWIRRGFWYAEVDAVIFNHKFNRDGNPIIGQPVGNTSSVIQRNRYRESVTGRRYQAGAEGVPRFTLGHFLFRDHKNRDHVGEFTVFGGGEWTQQARLDANPNNELGNELPDSSRCKSIWATPLLMAP